MHLRCSFSVVDFDSEISHKGALVEPALVSSATANTDSLCRLHKTGYLHTGKLFVELEALSRRGGRVINLPLVYVSEQSVQSLTLLASSQRFLRQLPS